MARNSRLWNYRACDVVASLLSLSILFCLRSAGQTQTQPQAAANKNPPEVTTRDVTPTFSTRSNLVLVRVVVRDREGHTNGNLRKEDFQLFDKGKQQLISRFSMEGAAGHKAESTPAGSPGEKSLSESASAAVPDRYVAYVFDDLHAKVPDLAFARQAAERHFTEAIPASSRAAIFTISGQTTLDFTDDVAKLRDTLRRIQPHPVAAAGACPDLSDYQSDLILNKQDSQALDAAVEAAAKCANLPSKRALEAQARASASEKLNTGDMETRMALKALDDVIRGLAARPGQRSIVLISPGFLVLDQRLDESEVIDRANRSNVTISTLDARGLYVLGPGSDASETGAAPGAMYQYQKESAMEDGATLAELADGTGGTSFYNSNDLVMGLKKLAAPPEYYYVLGFSPQNIKFDGAYHNLKVSLVKHLSGYKLQARHGYFAPKHEMDPALEAKQEMQEAIFSRDELHGLPAEVTAHVEDPKRPNPTLTVIIHVDPRTLQFRKEADRSMNTLIVDTALFDQDGKYVAGKESSLELRLKDATLRKLSGSGITAKTSFQVAPGSYRIREVVRDTESQQISALNCDIRVSPPTVSNQHERSTRSMADWTLADFTAAVPELDGLEPINNREALATLLERVGENVKAFFESFPDTTSFEEVILERLGWNDRILERKLEKFNYLDLSSPLKNAIGLEEYRTDSKNRPSEPQPLKGGFVTKGFTSMPAHFHPIYQPDSGFRYLGRQLINGRENDVVFFVQIPQKAHVTGSLKTATRSIKLLLQGLAWIDVATCQIIRMRTDLLEPRTDFDLKQVTTDSEFVETHFKGVPRAIWLPEHVMVTLNWRGEIIRNSHRYSNFKVFEVDTADRLR